MSEFLRSGELRVGGAALRTGYVEAVGTAPSHQRTGLGTQVMRAVGDYIAEHFELGALGTHHAFMSGWAGALCAVHRQ
jgi:hypothetical protein